MENKEYKGYFSLRGHNERVSSLVFSDCKQSKYKVTAILRHGLSTAKQDELHSIREKCVKNATYTIADIQNEIITIYG